MEKTKSLSEKWQNYLPQSTKTVGESLLFIKRMLYIVVSQIVKTRRLLKHEVFEKIKIGYVKFYVFSRNTTVGSHFSDLLRGVCEAIEKRFLHKLLLIILDPSDDGSGSSAIEVYTLVFTYACENGELSVYDPTRQIIVKVVFKGEEVLRKQIAYILQRITDFTSMLEPLPEGATPAIKLTYYDYAPRDYDPPGFLPCANTYKFKKNFGEELIGYACTAFHGCSISMKSIYIDNDILKIIISDSEDVVHQGQSPITTEKSKTSDSNEPAIECTRDEDEANATDLPPLALANEKSRELPTIPEKRLRVDSIDVLMGEFPVGYAKRRRFQRKKSFESLRQRRQVQFQANEELYRRFSKIDDNNVKVDSSLLATADSSSAMDNSLSLSEKTELFNEMVEHGSTDKGITNISAHNVSLHKKTATKKSNSDSRDSDKSNTEEKVSRNKLTLNEER